MIALRRKIPPRQELLALYAVIVFLIYGWGIAIFIWKVPSWLYFLWPGEIVGVLAYTLASSLVESTMILGIFLFMSLILPARMLSEKFLIRGSVVFYTLTFWVVLFHLDSLTELPTMSVIFAIGVGALLTLGLGTMLTDRMPLLRKLLAALGNRLIVFIYVWLPFGIAGILIVLFRII